MSVSLTVRCDEPGCKNLLNWMVPAGTLDIADLCVSGAGLWVEAVFDVPNEWRFRGSLEDFTARCETHMFDDHGYVFSYKTEDIVKPTRDITLSIPIEIDVAAKVLGQSVELVIGNLLSDFIDVELVKNEAYLAEIAALGEAGPRDAA